VLLGLAFLAGCGEKTVVVTGKLALPTTAKIVDTDSVTILFIPTEKDKKVPLAVYAPGDKSFTAKDVAPGKYKISVNIVPYQGMKDSEKRAPMFEGINKQFDRNETKLFYEATADPPQQSITVDLEKGAVTKS